MYLSYFTEDAYEKLLSDIDLNAEKYSSGEEWVSDYFVGQNYYETSKSVYVNSFTPYFEQEDKTDAQKSQEDLINTRNLYTAYKNLTPLQASNRYMWTYLCHAVPEYRKYIQERWPGSDIKTRYFVTNAATSLYNDNALSRLWWYGYLTYDDTNKSDHFALTKILLINQTICTDIMDTMNRMNPSRIKGVLLAVKDFDELLDGSGSTSAYLRKCNKYLNHYAAVTNMDFLEADEIHDLAYNYMIKLKEQETVGHRKHQ